MNTYYIVDIRSGRIIDKVYADDKMGAFVAADKLGYNFNKVDIVEA